MSENRNELPDRRQFERWCAEIQRELSWWLDLETGFSPPYRWATSGLDGIQSPLMEARSSGHGDPTGERATLLDKESPAYRCYSATRAAWKVRDALDALLDARTRLHSLERSQSPTQGPTLPGWQGKKEMARLHANQKIRQANGTGWGDA